LIWKAVQALTGDDAFRQAIAAKATSFFGRFCIEPKFSRKRQAGHLPPAQQALTPPNQTAAARELAMLGENRMPDDATPTTGH
jgi:hypothetical protein